MAAVGAAAAALGGLLFLKKALGGRKKDYSLGEAARVTFKSRSGAIAAQARLGGGVVLDPLAPLLSTEEDLAATVAGLKALPSGLVVNAGVTARMLDEMVAEAVKAIGGPCQVVMLGAGRSSRPWRVSVPAGTVWFDVGLSAEYKENAVQAVGAQIRSDQTGCKFALSGSKLTFVETNFDDSLWIVKLRDSGFHRGTPVVWVAEGLPSALDWRGVESLLRFTSFWSANGSVFMGCIFNDTFRQEIKSGGAEDVAKTIQFALQGGVERKHLQRVVDESQCKWSIDRFLTSSEYALQTLHKKVLEFPPDRPEMQCCVARMVLQAPAVAETESFTF